MTTTYTLPLLFCLNRVKTEKIRRGVNSPIRQQFGLGRAESDKEKATNI